MDTNCKNLSPLLNDTVIRNLFEFVSFSELKTCRLICSKWLALSYPFLKRNVQFTFRFEKTTRDSQEEEHEFKVLNIFLQNLDDSRDIKFAFVYYVPGRLEGIRRIIENHRDLIKKLIIWEKNEIRFSQTPPSEKLYDFSKAILNSHLTELDICSPDISISTDCLWSIESIRLTKCTVLLPSRATIFPKHLHISYVTFKVIDKIVDHVEINDFLDFSQLKELGLGQGGGCIAANVKEDSEIFNWSNMNWSVKLLRVCLLNSSSLSSFIIKPSTDIQELGINLFLTKNINSISWIPKTLTKLTLDHGHQWTKQQNSPLIFLPNLKYLSLNTSFYTEDFSFLENFSESLQNLEYLEIIHDTPRNRIDEVNQIKLQFVPPYVKKIKIKGKFQVSGNPRLFPLTSLILIDFKYQDIDDLLCYLNPESLTIKSLLDINYINRDIGLQTKRPSIKQITAGECKWENAKNCPKAYAWTKYVLFEKGNQTAITTMDFEKGVSF